MRSFLLFTSLRLITCSYVYVFSIPRIQPAIQFHNNFFFVFQKFEIYVFVFDALQKQELIKAGIPKRFNDERAKYITDACCGVSFHIIVR